VRLVHHAPKAGAFDVLRKVELPYIVAEKDRQHGRDKRHDHDDDQRDCRQSREQPEYEQETANGLDHTDEWAHDPWKRNSDPCEPARAQDIREDQLLDALRQEDHQADHEPDEHAPTWRIGAKQLSQTSIHAWPWSFVLSWLNDHLPQVGRKHVIAISTFLGYIGSHPHLSISDFV
jgi:hypothetical protein